MPPAMGAAMHERLSREQQILLHEQIIASERLAGEHPRLAPLVRQLARRSSRQLRWLGAPRIDQVSADPFEAESAVPPVP